VNRDEWDKSYTERNAKAEMWGASIAGIFFFIVPLFLILSIWNPYFLFFIPLSVLWVLIKRNQNKNKK